MTRPRTTRRAARTFAALTLAACTFSACTFSDGEPFARVTATLDARLATPADRDAGEGWQKLASDYYVRVDTMVLSLAAIELVDTGTGDSSGFDPADPPPGYSLCHNGHCHADDGRLVPYEEIAAELAGGGGGLAVVAALPVGEVDLVAGRAGALACEPPGCELPRAHVGIVRARVTRLRLTGQVRDGRAPARFEGEQAFSIDLTLPEGALVRGTLDLPSDRTHAPDVDLALVLAPTVGLLDGIDWLAQPQDIAGVTERVLELELGATIQR